MDVRDFAIHSLDEVQEVLTRSVDGLTQEELMSDKDFRDIAIEHLLGKVYTKLNDSRDESPAVEGHR